MKILIIDKDNISRNSLIKNINNNLNEKDLIYEFSEAIEALGYIKENKIDIIISEIDIIGINGLELLKGIDGKIKENIIFIILSNDNDFNNIRQAMKLGAYDYLLKSFSNEDIIKSIREAKKYLFEKRNKVNSLKEKVYEINKEIKNQYDNERTLNKEKSNSNLLVIKRAYEYIINNFDKEITLKEVADKVYLSQNYFSELFKKEVGIGFYEYLTSYRMHMAKKLLLESNLKIYQIAEKVGYKDSITFGRAFKKNIGKTPNKYRNENNKLNIDAEII